MIAEREVPDIKFLQLRHPFNGFLSGPTQCGKTTILRNILEKHRQTIHGINDVVVKVVWCYGHWQKYYEEPLYNVDFKYINCMPDEGDVYGSDIIVIDDLMHKIDKSPYLQTLFTAGTHHDNQSVIVLTQNYYQKGEICKTLRKNAHYVVLFKDPGDISQVQQMSWRMFPDNNKYLLSAYRQATSEPHGYLLVDRTQATQDDCRLRTRIVPNAETNHRLLPIGFDPI